MVSSIGFQLSGHKKITGFGVRRTCGRGSVRKVIGQYIARPALGYIANKVADIITGTGRRITYRKRRTAGSYKLAGAGKRKPRSTLVRKRKTGTGATRRAPRKTLGVRRRRVY